MLKYPGWLVHPQDPNAPLDMAHDIRYINLVRVLAEKVGLDPAAITDEQFSDLLGEFGENKEVLAIVEADAIEHAGLHDVNANNALEALAVEAARSGLHGYHPQKYASVGAMLRDKLADLDPRRQASEWCNLDWIANVFVPWLENHGYKDQMLEMLWGDNTKSKTRIMADILRGPFAAAGVKASGDKLEEVPSDLEAKVDALMRAVADARVTVEKFKEDFIVKNHKADMPALEAWDFKAPVGGYIVLRYEDEAQRLHVERAVKATWQLGTGKEAFIRGRLLKRPLRKRKAPLEGKPITKKK
jgi:hypothetical protein